MKKRKLGYTDEYISSIGLGCMGFSGIYGASNDDDAIKTLHKAIELGCNFWDTADAYGADGHNEKLIGKAIKGKEKKFFCQLNLV